MIRDPRPFPENPSPLPPSRKLFGNFTMTRPRLFLLACSTLLVPSCLIGGCSAANAPPSMTVQPFLHLSTPFQALCGPLLLPNGSQALPFWRLPKTPPAPLP